MDRGIRRRLQELQPSPQGRCRASDRENGREASFDDELDQTEEDQEGCQPGEPGVAVGLIGFADFKRPVSARSRAFLRCRESGKPPPGVAIRKKVPYVRPS